MISDHEIMPKVVQTSDDWTTYVLKMAIHKCMQKMEQLNKWETHDLSHVEIQMYHDSMETIVNGFSALKMYM